MSESEEHAKPEVDPGLRDEGNKWYDRDFATEFVGILAALGDELEQDPGRLRRPDTYIATDLDWHSARAQDLRQSLIVDFGDPDTTMGLAIDQPDEFGMSPKEFQDHARSACRTVLDLEAIAEAAGEADLADRALTLAARYADFYGLPVSGRTRVRQKELGLIKGK